MRWVPIKEIYDRLKERFRLIRMDTILNSYTIQITAGMRQRSVIAISTLLNPQMVIADEPTSALDVTTQKAVIKMIFDLLDKEIFSSMIFITHELPLLRHVSDRIAIMYAGEFVEVGTTEQIIFDPRHPYTRALMGAMLSAEPGQKQKKPVAIEGAPPNLAKPIAGCRFAERCPVARKECHVNKQEIRIVGIDGEVRLCRIRIFYGESHYLYLAMEKDGQAADDVSFTIADEEIVSLVGSSGCGKSVLAKIMLGLIHPASVNSLQWSADCESAEALRSAACISGSFSCFTILYNPLSTEAS